jgi:hypothetical protein
MDKLENAMNNNPKRFKRGDVLKPTSYSQLELFCLDTNNSVWFSRGEFVVVAPRTEIEWATIKDKHGVEYVLPESED